MITDYPIKLSGLYTETPEAWQRFLAAVPDGLGRCPGERLIRSRPVFDGYLVPRVLNKGGTPQRAGKTGAWVV